MLNVLESRKNDLERELTDAKIAAESLRNLPAGNDRIMDNLQRQNELIARISLYYRARAIRSDDPGIVEKHLLLLLENRSEQIKREKILRNMTESQKTNVVLDWIQNAAESLEAGIALKLIREGE